MDLLFVGHALTILSAFLYQNTVSLGVRPHFGGFSNECRHQHSPCGRLWLRTTPGTKQFHRALMAAGGACFLALVVLSLFNELGISHSGVHAGAVLLSTTTSSWCELGRTCTGNKQTINESIKTQTEAMLYELLKRLTAQHRRSILQQSFTEAASTRYLRQLDSFLEWCA
eukprot:5718801-Amphidinium_carterae.1